MEKEQTTMSNRMRTQCISTNAPQQIIPFLGENSLALTRTLWKVLTLETEQVGVAMASE